jgi:hypothetical protein
VAIVEGPFDAMAMPAAVALLGKKASARQLALFAQLARSGTEEFVISLDPDAAREADALRDQLSPLARVSYLPLTSGDPSSRAGEVQEMLAHRGDRVLTDRIRLRLCGAK